jgi:hypothetical protein
VPCCGQRRSAAARLTKSPVRASMTAVPNESAPRPVAPGGAPAPVPRPLRSPLAAQRPPAAGASSVAAISFPVAPLPPKLELPDGPAVLVRYLARAPARIVGAATGRRYDFTPASPVHLVAREDALTLLASPSFRPA